MERETISEITLNGNKFVPKTTQKDSIFSTYIKPESPKKDQVEDIPGGTIDDSDQISVFEAEDYFNEEKTKPVPKTEADETLEPVADSRVLSISSSIDIYRRKYRVNSYQATPTASSEASWNSQTGLLTNPQGSVPISLRSFSTHSPKRNSKESKRVKNWFLMRKCPCFGKKAVQVKDTIPNPSPSSSVSETRKALNSTSIRPIFNSTKSLNTAIIEPKNPTPTRPIIYMKKDPINVSQTQSSESQISSFTSNEQKPESVNPNFRRFSSENQIPKATHLRSAFPKTNPNGISFSFPILNPNSRIENIKNLVPNPNIVPLEDPPRESLEIFQPAPERNRRNYPFPTSPMSRIASGDDDVASDASSDLFELDSFSNVYGRRDSYDDIKRGSVDSVAATECYAPSEASVEWSVATGEGYGSVANFSASVSQVLLIISGFYFDTMLNIVIISALV